MRVRLVSNRAARGWDADVLVGVERVLAALGEVRRVEAKDKQTFERDVRHAVGPGDTVVVAGGDGTFNTTVNALGDRVSQLTFGLVPLGTGNDLARTLEVPFDAEEAARAVVSGTEAAIDVGRAIGVGVTRLFVNACMGGMAVKVNEALTEETKEKLGALAFWVAGAKAATELERFRVSVNGRSLEDCIAVGVGNGRTCGGGFEVWPEARPDDGLLDACALPAPDLGTAVKLVIKVKSGAHTGMDQVVTTTEPRVTIDADPPIELNVDGELVGLKTPATFEIAGQVRMRMPEMGAPA